jgi:hypothetical protein
VDDGKPTHFDWQALVPHCIHPLKVAIVEALLWVRTPLSASELQNLFSEKISVSLIAYHMTKLAQAGAIEKVGQRPVRGAMQKFYFFPDCTWEPGSGTLEPA